MIVPPRRRKIKLPSRPTVGKNIYRPVPPKTKIITVPSCRRKKYLSSRPVARIYLAELYCPVPPRICAPAVPSSQLFTSSFYRPVPTRRHFFSLQAIKICPVPSRPDSQLVTVISLGIFGCSLKAIYLKERFWASLFHCHRCDGSAVA